MKISGKKLISLCLALSMSATMYHTVSASGASDTYSTLVSENFEGDTYLGFTKYAETAEDANSIEVLEDYGLNKTFKSTQGYIKSESFSENTYILDKAAGYTNPENLYLETEFDINVAGNSPMIGLVSNECTTLDGTSPFTLKFDNTTKVMQLVAKEERRASSKTTYSLCAYETDKTYRIKIVMHITDDTENTCEEISAVYVDGINVLSQPVYFASDNEAKIPYVNSILINSAKSVNIDNISVYKYTSSNGISPVVNKGRLVGLIRNTNEDTENSAALAAAKGAYENIQASQSDVDSAFNALYDIECPAAVEYTSLFSENFEGAATKMFYVNDGTGTTECLKLVNASEYATGKMYTSSGRGTVNSEVFKGTYMISGTDGFTAQDNNLYLEMSFDIKPISASSTSTVSLVSSKDTSRKLFGLAFNPTSGKVTLSAKDTRSASSVTTTELTDYSVNNLYRVRMVISVKDNDGESAEKISAIYINGKNVLSTPKYFETTNISCADALRIAGATAMYMDNIDIVNYTSARGNSPVVNKDKLVSLIRDVIDMDLEELTVAKAVYESNSATQEQVDEAYTNLYNAVVNPEVTTILDENFEGETSLKFYHNSTNDELQAADTITTLDEYGMNNVFKGSSWAYSEAFEKTYVLYDAEGYNTAKNTYLETEFDVKTSGYDSTGNEPAVAFTSDATTDTNLTIVRFNTQTSKIQILGKTEKRSSTGASYIDAGDFEVGTTHRVKVVMHISDSSDVTCEEISALYVDGVNVLSAPIYFASHSSGKIGYFNRIRLMSPGRMNIDNISIKRYASAFGVSPVINKGELVSVIRETDAFANKACASAEFKTALNTAKTVYESETAQQSEIDEAIKKLNNAYDESPKADNPFTVESFSIKDSSGNASYTMSAGGTVDGVYVTKNFDYAGAKMIVALYNNGVLESVQLADVPASLASGVVSVISLPTVLELPTGDINNYTLSAFMFESFATINPVADKFSIVYRAPSAENGITVYLAGDSTVATYSDTYYPQAGWGQMLPNYLDSTKVTVDNRAVGGRSSKSFINEGRLNKILNEINAGDYLFIQFAHNDSKSSLDYYTNPNTTYKEYLLEYIRGARKKGAYPIFVTSPARCLWSGTTFTGEEGLKSYATSMKSIASTYNVPVIDLMSDWTAFITNEGAEAAKDYYLFINANDERFTADSEFAGSTYNKDSATEDTTHFQRYGADVMAGMIAKEISQLSLPLSVAYSEGHTPVKP